MRTVYATDAPPTGVVPLGGTRRNGRSLDFRHDADHSEGIRFLVSLLDGTELGTIIVHEHREAELDWAEAAGGIGITSGNLTEKGLLRLMTALAASITTGAAVPAEFNFKKADDCPYAFAVNALGMTCVS
ncbi:hypothetical protein [Glycomyces sp. MUSA5-2]|uniref:hypothetical protein n=1 Tax=Glycomyces sp. MUSA5-2 TaxID=2053002 RepID=UPI00300995C1